MVENYSIVDGDNLSKRLPEKCAGDVACEMANVAISEVPFIGGIVSVIIKNKFPEKYHERMRGWLHELAETLDGIKEKGIDIKSLCENDEFMTSVNNATRIAIATHQKEKHEMLKNALFNIGIGKGPQFDKQAIFMNAVNVFTPSHVRILKLLHEQIVFINKNHIQYDLKHVQQCECAVQVIFPEMNGDVELIRYIIAELKSYGFSKMSGGHEPFPQVSQATNMGIEFISFISKNEGND